MASLKMETRERATALGKRERGLVLQGWGLGCSSKVQDPSGRNMKGLVEVLKPVWKK